MLVKVTKHAVKRYRERLFDYMATDTEIINRIIGIATKGDLICSKPNQINNCMEIKYKGVSIVVIQDQTDLVVITCLGEANYRRWIKSKGESTFISQRLRHCK